MSERYQPDPATTLAAVQVHPHETTERLATLLYCRPEAARAALEDLEREGRVHQLQAHGDEPRWVAMDTDPYPAPPSDAAPVRTRVPDRAGGQAGEVQQGTVQRIQMRQDEVYGVEFPQLFTSVPSVVVGRSAIPPALRPVEWRDGRADLNAATPLQVVFGDGSILLEHDGIDTDDYQALEVRGDEALAAVAAAALSQLSDGHPLKPTRKRIAKLRALAESVDGEWGVGRMDDPDAIALLREADALEAVIQPEGA